MRIKPTGAPFVQRRSFVVLKWMDGTPGKIMEHRRHQLWAHLDLTRHPQSYPLVNVDISLENLKSPWFNGKKMEQTHFFCGPPAIR